MCQFRDNINGMVVGKWYFFDIIRDEIVEMGRKFDVMSEKCFHGEWNVEWWPKF